MIIMKPSNRVSKIEYYLNIAQTVAQRSTCSRRKFGAVIVKNDAIISSGYNGAARGTYNCGVDVPCIKDIHNEEHYTSYRHCPAIHGEMNAILNAARHGASVLDGTLYLSPHDRKEGDRPCHLCRRMMINSGIKDCYYINRQGEISHEQRDFWVELENKETFGEYLDKLSD